MAVLASEVANSILGALGISKTRVSRVSIVCEPGSVAVVRIERHLDPSEAHAIAESIWAVGPERDVLTELQEIAQQTKAIRALLEKFDVSGVPFVRS